MKIAGLDIGTTGCKCTVFDESGIYLDKAYRDYPVKRAVSGHEADVSAIMDGVYEVLAEAAAKHPEIAGIGITSFGETFVMTDEAGIPLLPAMLYTDPRGAEQCSHLVSVLGGPHIAGITGLHPHEMYSISKLMWIRQNRPEYFTKAAFIFLMEDYVVFHLTGRRQIDYSLASRTMAFDIVKLTWSDEILDAAGVDSNRLSQPVPAGTDVGAVTEAAAARTGLSAGTRIILAGHDQVAAAVGAGAFDSSVAVDGAGTVECITPVFDTMPDIESMYAGYFAVVPYVIPGKYVAYAFTYTGGALMQWCTQTLAKRETELAEAMGISVNEYLEELYDRTGETTLPTGLLVLPHFAGAATPYMDTGSKGAILGLTTNTSVAEIYRACMEGVVYEMYLNAGTFRDSGNGFSCMHATGGGAHSAEWMQMKADILNIPITALRTADAGTVGCAMMAGTAVGLFRDLEDAAMHMVEKTVTYKPRPHMHDAYMKVYRRYEKLYRSVRPLMCEANEADM